MRRKRVIDLTRNGGTPISLFRAPYIVNILHNEISQCAGAILDADIIITAPLCIDESHGVTYNTTILSNSALRDKGTPHHVVRSSSNRGYGFGDSFNYFAFLIRKNLVAII